MRVLTSLLSVVAIVVLALAMIWPRCGPATATYLVWGWTGPHCAAVLLPGTQ